MGLEQKLKYLCHQSLSQKGEIGWGWKSTWRNIVENFPNLSRDVNPLIQEAEQGKQDKPKDRHMKIFIIKLKTKAAV